MASIFKRPGSPYWFVAFDVTTPDGKVRRLKKSTKQKVRADALKEALRIEEAETALAIGGADISKKAFGALTEAAEAAARGELSEARAREIIAKMTEASTGTPLRFYTVRTWAADWQAGKATATKGATSTRYKANVDTFLAFLGKRADSRLEAITRADIREFRDAIRKGFNGSPRSASTTNYYTADVAAMFRAAVREGLLLASPAAAIGKLSTEDSAEREPFTIAEVAQLVEAAGNRDWHDAVFSKRRTAEAAEQRCREWQGMILLGFYSGARLGDCAAMQWENVNLKAGTITFTPRKTSRKRKKLEVPIHPRLAAYFREIHEPGIQGPLFPAIHASSVAGKTGLSGQFAAIVIAANIDRRTVREAKRDKKGKVVTRSQQAKTFHSLRHALTSQLANLDVPEEIRRRITGHESAAVHQGYTHTERETLARSLEKLPSI